MKRMGKAGKQESLRFLGLFSCIPVFLICLSAIAAEPVMRRDRADKLGLRTISDLRAHPELRFGLTHEFLDRQDGWRPLAQRYQLNPQNVLGIDHALGYAALKAGSVDAKDAYSTDAK